jgi:hypothetical protein
LKNKPIEKIDLNIKFESDNKEYDQQAGANLCCGKNGTIV